MSGKYNESRPVTIPDHWKMLELEGFQEILYQYSILNAYWRKGVYNPEHDVLCVEFISSFEDQQNKLVVDITPSKNYPYEEPGAVLVYPDIGWIGKEGIQLHVYPDMGHRLLCAHLTDWNPKTSIMAKFFINGVVPWANNFSAWVFTNGKWQPDHWNMPLNKK